MSDKIVSPGWFDLMLAAAKVIDALPKRIEHFEFPCTCAIHDRPYILRYQVTATGQYPFIESLRISSRRPIMATDEMPGQFMPTLSLNRLEQYWPCAWCSSPGFTICSVCDNNVCQGRQRGNLFRCRHSCGALMRADVMLAEISGMSRSLTVGNRPMSALESRQPPSLQARTQAACLPLLHQPKRLGR